MTERRIITNTFDAHVSEVPDVGVTLEQYRAQAGVPIDPRAEHKQKAARQSQLQTQFYHIDRQIDESNTYRVGNLIHDAGVADRAQADLEAFRAKVTQYDAVHGEGAWQTRLNRWQAIEDGEAEATPEDLEDADFIELQDLTTELIDYSLPATEEWATYSQNELTKSLDSAVAYKDEHLDSFVRNAIRDAITRDIHINHPEADGIIAW